MTDTPASLYVVAQPTYDDDGVDSIWTNESDALARAASLGSAFITEYEANKPDGWLRNGWHDGSAPKCWSDWGFKNDETEDAA